MTATWRLDFCRQRGVGVRVLRLGEPRTSEAQAAARAYPGPVTDLDDPRPADLVIDALFGGGFRPGTKPEVAEWSQANHRVLAVDLPSGLDPATGEVPDVSFTAERTVTFGALRLGHVLGEGPDRCGLVSVADIGLGEPRPTLRLAEATDAELPSRSRQSHKWSAGSVLVVGGAKGMTGAALLAARAALRFGAGAVGVAVPPESAQIAAAAAPDLLHHSFDLLPDRYQVLLVGPGLGSEHQDWARGLITRWPGPVVADADALASVVPRTDLVVTPHAGEFERMSGSKPSFATAATLAENLGATVLLKGNPTFIAGGGIPWLVDSGGPELATIGTGDVLAGMVAALLANGLSPEAAALSAAFWHGRAGAALAATETVTAPGLLDEIGRWR